MKSAPASGFLIMSGLAVIICYQGLRDLFDLYQRSPMALERFRFPFTRPYQTYPPARLILFSSIQSQGLWSLLSAYCLPLTHRTLLESPALAQQISVSVMRTTLAVQPAKDYTSVVLVYQPSFLIAIISFFPDQESSISSILRNVSVRASQNNFLSKFLFLSSYSQKCLSANLATSAPPWPSKTANMEHSLVKLGLAMCASSMEILQPHMPLAQKLSLLDSPNQGCLVLRGVLLQAPINNQYNNSNVQGGINIYRVILSSWLHFHQLLDLALVTEVEVFFPPYQLRPVGR